MNERVNGAPGTPEPSAPEAQAQGASKGRRGKTRAEERIEALDVSPTALTAQLETAAEQLATLEVELAETKASLQRMAADFSNFRRRTEQQRADELGLANQFLILKVLGLADDFDRAIEHVPPDQAGSPWVEGIAAIDRKMRGLLESEGVTAMEPTGKPFDPREHEAIASEPTTSVPDGTVLRELQRGYYLRDRVLRPALVSVASNDGTKPSSDPDNDDSNDSADPAQQGRE